METIRLKSQVGADGVLNLSIPTEFSETELEVVLVVQPMVKAATASGEVTSEKLGWPPGFFDETFGCLRDDPLTREAQGEYEMREELR